jgi:hypothetical protein
MKPLRTTFLSLLTMAAAAAALAAPPPSCPQAAPLALETIGAPAAIPAPAPKPRFLSQFPTCAPGYGYADEECIPCGWDSYQGCATCVNLWTDDQYTVCGSCSTSVCTPP